jgi:ubiquitin-conjugating enzyme E2 variant
VDLSNPSSPLAPSRAFRHVETASTIACAVVLIWLARDVVWGVSAHRPGWIPVLSAAVAAYLFADFVAGFVHFIGDSFCSVDTPLLGPTFVLPFRDHHVHPQAICDHDFVATNGNNAFATLFLATPVLISGVARHGGWWVLLGVFVCVLSALSMFTNQIHKWAHVDAPPPLVRTLQRAGMLLSPERHAAHHRPPYVGGYCVTSGLCNRLLDPLGFFPFAERTIRVALRAPKRKP